MGGSGIFEPGKTTKPEPARGPKLRVIRSDQEARPRQRQFRFENMTIAEAKAEAEGTAYEIEIPPSPEPIRILIEQVTDQEMAENLATGILIPIVEGITLKLRVYRIRS